MIDMTVYLELCYHDRCVLEIRVVVPWSVLMALDRRD